jgi:hypothetical protein
MPVNRQRILPFSPSSSVASLPSEKIEIGDFVSTTAICGDVYPPVAVAEEIFETVAVDVHFPNENTIRHTYSRHHENGRVRNLQHMKKMALVFLCAIMSSGVCLMAIYLVIFIFN